MARKKVDDGFRGEQSAKAAKKKKKSGMSPGAMGGRRSGMSPGAMGGSRTKTGPARTIAEAKRRGLSTFTDKSGKKKAAVTAEELKKSGLSLRDYLNKQQGKTRAGPKAPTTKPTSKPTRKNPLAGNKFLQASAKNVGKTKKTPVQVSKGTGKAAASKKTPIQEDLGSGVRGNQPLGPGTRKNKDTSTPYTPIGMKAGGMKKGYKVGGMKKGYSMGGMKKKGMAAGGLNAAIKMVDKQKKGMAMGGMKKSMKKGGKVRGAGIERKGLRKAKYI